MFTFLDLVQPETVEDAYNLLISKKNNTVLGGCAYLRLGSKRIGTAIDLAKLGLDYVKVQDGYLELGAMTTFRDLETNPIVRESFNGILPKAIGNIIGVQFRNIVTVGASVYSKYGFSDLITALLALDTEVVLHQGGRMPLAKFLESPCKKDILIKILIKKNYTRAAYQNLRKSASDYPILNVAVSNLNEQWTVAVGARPSKAKIAHMASQVLTNKSLTAESIAEAASIAAEELSFGSNARGTAEYRRAICEVLVKRAITEVLQCR